MDKIFFADITKGKSYFYTDLINDLNKSTYYHRFCYTDDFYVIFKSIILSFLSQSEIILLDYDFSRSELTNLNISEKDLLEKVLKPKINIRNLKDLLNRMHLTENWKITLYTSGTTGIPKKITHSFGSVARSVRISEDKGSDIWGFAYNPTHMAGLQVFFQALLNSNTIVNIFQKSRQDIFLSINKYFITHISATPTYFRMLLPYKGSFKTVRKVSFGGEKLDTSLMSILEKMFPNAKFLNIYASTEAGTIFASIGENFVIKNDIKKYVKIVKNEILIHKFLLGESESLNLNGDWYHTGDIIKIIDRDPLIFKFVSRKNEMINIGGNKVNPLEIEHELNKHPEIKNSKVYSRKNPITGRILCAEIELLDKTISEKEIRIFLKNKLQDFKIPRIIDFIDKIKMTRTGKIKR